MLALFYRRSLRHVIGPTVSDYYGPVRRLSLLLCLFFWLRTLTRCRGKGSRPEFKCASVKARDGLCGPR